MSKIKSIGLIIMLIGIGIFLSFPFTNSFKYSTYSILIFMLGLGIIYVSDIINYIIGSWVE